MDNNMDNELYCCSIQIKKLGKNKPYKAAIFIYNTANTAIFANVEYPRRDSGPDICFHIETTLARFGKDL